MQKRIYLSGPLSDCSEDEIRVWRDRVVAVGNTFKGSTLSSITGGPIHFEFVSPKPFTSKEKVDVVSIDKNDIRKSDLVLVFPWSDSIGTAMEVMYAHMIGVPVYMIHDLHWSMSPWYTEHARCFSASLDDSLSADGDILSLDMKWLNTKFDRTVEMALITFIKQHG